MTTVDRTHLSSPKRGLEEVRRANEAAGPSIFDSKPNVDLMRQRRSTDSQKPITKRRAIKKLAKWIDAACDGEQKKIDHVCDLIDLTFSRSSFPFDHSMSELLER